MKTVALLLADEHNAYQQLLVTQAMEHAGRFGIEVLPPRFAETMPVKQIGQFFDCISSGTPPDGIVSMLVAAESMRSALDKTAAAGIDCVLVNRIPASLPEISTMHPEVLLTSVAPDQVEIGRFQGRQCLRLLPEGGNVVLVLGTSETPSAFQRREGFLEVVGDAVTVKELQGRWLMDRAQAAVNHFFSITGMRDRVDLFVCQNDPMAAGVRAALDNQAKLRGSGEIAKIPIIGCDGLPDEGQKMVRNKQIVATVVMPPSTPRALEILGMYWSSGVRAHSTLLAPTSFPPLQSLTPHLRG